MTYRKKLIEVALPLEAINEASAREKSIRHGHPSTLHLWWARRPLAACRAVIFASLVDDPDDPDAPPKFVKTCRELPKGKNASDHDTPRQRLFDFIETLVQWESTTDETVLEQARELIRLATDGNPPSLMDPFAGGGSIPLEAQRLGLKARASDLNPVAVMICKALIEIPPKFANKPPVNPRDAGRITNASYKGAMGLAADVRYYGEWMRERAWKRIGHLYPCCNGETVIAWLWARTVRCPNPACGAQMPLVTSFELSKKKGKQAWVEPHVERKAKTVRFIVKQGTGKAPDPPKVGRGAKFRCLVCDEVAPDRHLKDEGMSGRMGAQLMAIVTEGRNGRNYHSPISEHKQIAALAQPKWLPKGELADDTRAIWCKIYGLVKFADLFTLRQLVALTTFSDLVGEVREQIRADAVAANVLSAEVPLSNDGRQRRAYAEAVSIYLAFAVDKAADHWSSLASWRNSVQAHRTTFARQALPMVWDYVEINPFSSSAGNWNDACIALLEKAISAAPADLEPGYAHQADATTAIQSDYRLVLSTDPPYYDNIGYADLSDYFYTWLRHSLREIYPETFSTLLVPKEQELVAAPHRFNGDAKAANKHFEDGLQKAFVNMCAVGRDDYPLSLYYAFKQSEIVEERTTSTGWETMLTALLDAGFSIVGTWPIRTERSGRMISVGANALASSIVLVCRLRTEDAPITTRREFVNSLRRELPVALREMQSGNIAPVDLAQASIGPGMAIYSRCSKVLEPNGDRLTVRTALQLINQVLDEYLAETEGELDADSRFAVAWFEQHGFSGGQFGVADVLARAKNTSVEGLANAGILKSGAGRARLLTWEDLDPSWDPSSDVRLSAWEATHHLIERLNVHGEEGAAMLLAKMPPDLTAAARHLAYRLYSICERKGWAEHARDYNALVISWSSSQEQAVQYREQYQQSRLFE